MFFFFLKCYNYLKTHSSLQNMPITFFQWIITYQTTRFLHRNSDNLSMKETGNESIWWRHIVQNKVSYITFTNEVTTRFFHHLGYISLPIKIFWKISRNMVKCAAFGCTNRSSHSKSGKVNFHSIPTEEKNNIFVNAG